MAWLLEPLLEGRFSTRAGNHRGGPHVDEIVFESLRIELVVRELEARCFRLKVFYLGFHEIGYFDRL
jgi:hypothetical protein